jgi:hypothetical protein
LGFAGFLDTEVLKATKLGTNSPKMLEHRKMGKNYHSLSHLRRCTTDAKWKCSQEWFDAKCQRKRQKSAAPIYYQLKVGHALDGPYLKQVTKQITISVGGAVTG